MIFKNSLNYISQFFFFFTNKARNFYLNSNIYNKKISKINDKNLEYKPSPSILDCFIKYDKKKAINVLKKIGWKPYENKHGESIYTRFYQSYYLPKKFGIDKRKAHLSNLILSNQISREEGIMVGYSAGSAISAINQLKDKLTKDDVVVVIFHDHGTRYVGKLFNDEWMKEMKFM